MSSSVPPRRLLVLFFLSIAPVLVGLAASAVLVVDYARPAPVFCSEGGGCDAVRHTAFSHLFGVPLPWLGLAGFLAVAVASIAPGPRARLAQVVLASVAGLAGLSLLVVQASIGHFCPYCCAADAGGIVAAAVAWLRFRRAREADDVRPPSVLTIASAASVVVAVAAPLVLGAHLAKPTPEVIRGEIAKTPRGAVTVVDFVDFECPYCRMTHADLDPVLRQHVDHVRVVRRQVPLGIHPHAMEAARAACCGERLGHGEAMADALFTAPVTELTRGGCERIAERVGLALDRYRACVSDPETERSIEADRAEFKAAGGHALPTVWIGERELVGVQPRDEVVQILGDALARAGG